MISLLHPSRSRPKKAYDTLLKWWRKDLVKGEDFEHILSLDSDDKSEYSKYFGAQCTIIWNKNKSAVDAINAAAKYSQGDILIVISDDTECTETWYEDVLRVCSRRQDFILKTQDGIQPWIITMPIMDRTYYERFGYIYHPDYQHMFCDTELTCVADLTGRKIVSNLMFPHKHYSVTKESQDEVSKRADKTWDQGEKLFLERYKRNFDLKETPGKIVDNGMINWLHRKVR